MGAVMVMAVGCRGGSASGWESSAASGCSASVPTWKTRYR